MALTPAALARYQGRFIARGGKSVTLEGPEETRRLALVEFPTLELAQTFFASPEYQAAKACATVPARRSSWHWRGFKADQFRLRRNQQPRRHCERSEAIQGLTVNPAVFTIS
jgi:uncharacterized protein (DUF1330 family)